MNYDKNLKVILEKSKYTLWTVLALLGMVLIFSSCEKEKLIEDDIEIVEEYPSIKVVNELNDYWRSITSVELVGYDFDNLNIEYNGDSQTFVLDKGMSGGYEDIYVTVRYIRYQNVMSSRSIEVNFTKGETTTITLTGSDGCEGCPGIYLE